MTLLIACMIIHGFNLHWSLYVLATFLWTLKITVRLIELSKE